MHTYTAQEIIDALLQCVHMNTGTIYSTSDDTQDEEDSDEVKYSDGYGFNDDYYRIYDMASNSVIFIFKSEDNQPSYINLSSENDVDIDLKEYDEIKKYLLFQQYRSAQIMNDIKNPLKKHF